MNSLSPQQRTASGHLWMVLGMLCLGFLSTGCKAIVAQNNRNWAPDQAKLPISEVHGDQITIHNVRNCRYATADDYVVQYYDKDIRLSDIQTVDFIVVPFKDTPSVAHTMLSFGMSDGQYLVSSVEIRKEANEEYSAWKGFFNQYELMYVIGDERDVINLSSNYYKSDVYLYRTVAQPEQAQELFLDVVKRANQLAASPEFYNTVTNNCTTNIVSHVNKIAPKSVPYDMRILLPGYSDEYAYSLGLLDTSIPFAQLRSESKINQLAERYRDDENFSQYIRR
ncbi:DUF4105 domain-containing protein [Bremerella sp. JC770]|uniref:Lnb N-terminal periplasmic domain-containing protein n=1 Tax=Bremerella sp. JC770 TaxID=3232137 RepID=UPI00345ABDFA